jgi:hypothetical protein
MILLAYRRFSAMVPKRTMHGSARPVRVSGGPPKEDYLDGQRVVNIAATNRRHPDHDTGHWPKQAD